MNIEPIGYLGNEHNPAERALCTRPYAVEQSNGDGHCNSKVPSGKVDLLLMLQRAHLEKTLKMSRSKIYALMAKNRFPRPIRYGDSGGVYWIAKEVAEWLDEQIRRSRSKK